MRFLWDRSKIAESVTEPQLQIPDGCKANTAMRLRTVDRFLGHELTFHMACLGLERGEPQELGGEYVKDEFVTQHLVDQVGHVAELSVGKLCLNCEFSPFNNAPDNIGELGNPGNDQQGAEQ
jgi:hypothetical protein